MKNIPPSPSLTTTTWRARYKAYPVSAAFGRHAVRLTAAQRRWLLHVMRSSTYKSRIGKLEFALFPGRDTPLIVFVDDGTPGVPDLENYNVIGDCGITFSYDRGVDGHACGLLP